MLTVAVSMIFSLAIFVGVITGAASQVRNTACAGRYINRAGECVRYRTCSSEGQYIRKAGNETQDNKCFCDGSNRFAPREPKRCFEENNPNSCFCLQCPPETLLNITENGVYVEKFNPKVHCVPLKKEHILPSDNRFDWEKGFYAMLVLFIIMTCLTITILLYFLFGDRQKKGYEQIQNTPLQVEEGFSTNDDSPKEGVFIDINAKKGDDNKEETPVKGKRPAFNSQEQVDHFLVPQEESTERQGSKYIPVSDQLDETIKENMSQERIELGLKEPIQHHHKSQKLRARIKVTQCPTEESEE